MSETPPVPPNTPSEPPANAPAPPTAGPAADPLTLRYRAAMDALAAGDLSKTVPELLDIQANHPDREEAFFCEDHLRRIRRLWPAEAEKAGLTAEAFSAMEARAQARRAGKLPEGQDFVPIALLLVAAAWSFLVVAAPTVAFLGRGPESVALIFRLVALVVGAVSAGTAFGLMKRKWEAVNVFIILVPVFMIVTFIGLTEATDTLARIACGAGLALEIYAGWYMSKHSNRFVY